MSEITIISGGQTGVDRAALDFAIGKSWDCGGWCPLGRKAEDGRIAPKYPLTESDSSEYEYRTELNVKDSDGTLLLYLETLDKGCQYTYNMAVTHHKPHLLVNMQDEQGFLQILNWIKMYNISVLNIAGPRESSYPGIYEETKKYLHKLFVF
ncbi:MAG: putative molybdenum carrier protein [Bacteroidota bacterium]|nr:putative molybdenum carrier protein [Bacteroidota bacterium]